MITNNGLSNEEFIQIKKSISGSAKSLLNICHAWNGNLVDLIGHIRIIQSSLQKDCEKLREIFEEQKKITKIE